MRAQSRDTDVRPTAPAGSRWADWTAEWDDASAQWFFCPPDGQARERREPASVVLRPDAATLERLKRDDPSIRPPPEAPTATGSLSGLTLPPPRPGDHNKRARVKIENTVQAMLSADDSKLFEANPHVRQVWVNGGRLVRASAPLGRDDRLITAACGRTKYHRRQGQVKTTVADAERQTLLGIIEFLTEHLGSQRRVMYTGAAPGLHVPFLSSCFPTLRWQLIDHAAFECELTDRIEVINETLSASMAQDMGGRGVLFICDMHSPEGLSTAATEERRRTDMATQQHWVTCMKPRAAWMRFRLPYQVPCDARPCASPV